MILSSILLKIKRYKIEIDLFLKNIFKYKHGYNNCIKKRFKCPVCKTPWPEIKKTPTKKYLESIGYYNKFTKVKLEEHILIMPKGMSGKELIDLANRLKPEYDILINKK